MSLIVTVGLSQLLGGLKNGIQHFDREAVGMAASMMMLAVIGLWLPTIFGFLDQLERGVKLSSSFEDPALISLSRYISMMRLILYGFAAHLPIPTALQGKSRADNGRCDRGRIRMVDSANRRVY
jgi:Ca2+/H+ antiporter